MENGIVQTETETGIHESRLADSQEAYKAPENHLFRKAYRQLTDWEKQAMDKIKDHAFALHSTLDQLAGLPEDDSKRMARGLAIAKTKLEESVMWAVKAITG